MLYNKIMNEIPLTDSDTTLINAAKQVLQKLYKKQRHGVAAALRTKSGKIVTGIHLETSIGRMAICAEAIALGKAIAEGENTFSTIVAVWYPEDDETKEAIIAPPCGMCREMLYDYQPTIEVITQENGRIKKVALAELLPNRASEEYNR